MRAINDYMKLAADVAKHNASFAEDVREEIVELVNDILDALTPVLKDKDYAKSVFSNAVLTRAMPLSYGIFNDFLLGNLQACFMQLRTMLEALVKAHYADMISDELFTAKMKKFTECLREIRISTSEVLKSLEEYSPEASCLALKIWNKCSEEWVHPNPFFEKLVEIVIKHERPPAYSLALPMIYGEEDREPLNELKNLIKDFRKLFKMLIVLHYGCRLTEVKNNNS